MANKVNKSPAIPFAFNLSNFPAISDWASQLVGNITSELQDHALRLNTAVVGDGTETPSAPIIYKPYVKASLPSASKYINGMIIVTDEAGGRVPAFSDGTNWRRVTDRAVVS